VLVSELKGMDVARFLPVDDSVQRCYTVMWEKCTGISEVFTASIFRVIITLMEALRPLKNQ
jgi:hypothetical protein